MTTHQELFEVADRLEVEARAADTDDVSAPLSALEKAARKVGRTFSGSWQGYHSRVYYSEFSDPPPGAHFSQEWGLMDRNFTSLGSRGAWREYTSDAVRARVLDEAGHPNLERAHATAARALEVFEFAKSDIGSALQNELEQADDGFLRKLKEQLEKLVPLSAYEIAERYSPKGAVMTRDTIILGQGKQIPPHMTFLAEIGEIRHAFDICGTARDIARKTASHIERKDQRRKKTAALGTNVFIGHGRSTAWKDLKDFVQDRLRLPWDEFNRVPVAGVTNVARLLEMLDSAAIAFLIMTADDEMADGALQARMNVVHEAGLFQGRLGFTKSIVLLEDGCEQFSNIEGLGQIRFPLGNIAAAFEEIRRVLEREGLLSP